MFLSYPQFLTMGIEHSTWSTFIKDLSLSITDKHQSSQSNITKLPKILPSFTTNLHQSQQNYRGKLQSNESNLNWNEHDPFNQNVLTFCSLIIWIGLVQPEKFWKRWSTFPSELFSVGPILIVLSLVQHEIKQLSLQLWYNMQQVYFPLPSQS